MQPESSDGFASVGTILPEEGAALLPGGSFRFCPIFDRWAAGTGERVRFKQPGLRRVSRNSELQITDSAQASSRAGAASPHFPSPV